MADRGTTDAAILHGRVREGLRLEKEREGLERGWCPLGEGAVDRKFFAMLKQSGYNGPISQHYEYQVGTGAAMIAAMKKDLDVLKQWPAT